MPTKKKRAAFSSSAIPLSAIKETLEQEAEDHKRYEQASESVPVSSAPDLDAVLAQESEEPALKKNNVMLYRTGIVFVGVIVVVTLVLYGISVRMARETTPIVTKEIIPTPSSAPVFDPKTISIEVYNGSGVSGAAARGATALKNKGYVVTGTGNTKKTPESGVFLSKTLSQDTRTSFLADMSTLFGISSSSGDLVESSASARLILGVK